MGTILDNKENNNQKNKNDRNNNQKNENKRVENPINVVKTRRKKVQNKKPIRFNTLRGRLLVTYLLVGFLPLILFSYTAINEIEKFYIGDRKSSYMSSANIISGYVTKASQLTDPEQKSLLDAEIREKAKEGSFRVLIFNNDAVIVSDSNNNRAKGKMYVVPEVMSSLMGTDDVNKRSDEQTIYAAASILNENKEIIGSVLVVASIEDVYLLISEMRSSVYFYMLIFFIIVIFFVLMMSKFFLSPFNKILKVLEKMADGHLEQRINLNGNDEFTDIASAFNNMAEKLELVEVTRDEFVSNVSHELKTPLSTIKVLSESILIEENVPTEMYVEFLQDINSEIDRMTDIVNDLLALVKLDQREMALNKEVFRIDLLVIDIVKRLQSLANVKNIKLTANIEDEAEIFGDYMKLTLAISNIIENAIKYTMEGSVTVTFSRDHQNVFITVQDTGIGIALEEQDKIFRRFYRVDKTRDRETGGTGLGLAITHSTILLHNGAIRVNSVQDEGSTFIVRIPILTS